MVGSPSETHPDGRQVFGSSMLLRARIAEVGRVVRKMETCRIVFQKTGARGINNFITDHVS